MPVRSVLPLKKGNTAHSYVLYVEQKPSYTFLHNGMFLTAKQPTIGSRSNQYLQGYILVAMVTINFLFLWPIRQLDDSHRVTVYCRDGDGRTGLHHAARMGGWDC